MLFFDEQGHLTPYTLIQTDWAEFVDTFGWNQRRIAMIDALRALLDQLQTLTIRSFDLWIDGSFVTQKELPNDIDVVLFLRTADHQTYERPLRTMRDQFQWIDLYLIRKCNEDERDHFPYLSDGTEWLFQFTTTRPDKRTYRKYPKGFLELNWPHEQAVESA